ncbi:FAD-dependent oxidoreductase [Vallitalea okinawensis]|uniref:FAD-dependent oxidoreductase n=1 Tax=Vallitalea okinawensis TaxID=2078660 RepID=UPI000CFCFD72|nr:FAD-dependent oxidoreductase [Vallitalea okinawensis]
MNTFKSHSYWITSTEETSYPALKEDLRVDALVIGGGIAGITSATLLSDAGLSIALIEANRICRGTTGHTTAKITSQHNLIYADLIKHLGFEKAEQYAIANQHAIRKIRQLVKQYSIDCQLTNRNAYVYTDELSNVCSIEKEVKAAQSLNLPADYVTNLNFPVKSLSGIRFSNQAEFHPRKYILKLAYELTKKAPIYENTRALDIDENTPYTISTTGGKVIADYVIVASHYPFYDKGSFYFAKMYPETSYIVGTTMKHDFNTDMYIGFDDPTRSLRSYSSESEHLLLVGGESHKTGKGKDGSIHYKHLENFIESVSPQSPIRYRWLAQDYITLDKVPYIGLLNRNMDHVYVATGFGKWGMTSGTVAAMIIKDLILKGKNPWASVFSPSRHLDGQKIKQIIVNGTDSAYELIKGKLTDYQSTLEAIPIDQCNIIEINSNNIGVYKDKNGELFAVDITCQHLKCELVWNQAERTWDCPCHGSRYNYRGEVFDGPSNANLVRIDIDSIFS